MRVLVWLVAAATVAAADEDLPLHDPLLETLKQHEGFTPEGIVDCGANKGDWTRFVRHLWPDAAILMLEANPHLKPAIDEVAAKAGNAEAVTAVLTDRPGQELKFYFSEDSPTGGSLFKERSDVFEKVEPTTVISRTLDLVVSASQVLQNKRVDLIKLDIQGAELIAMRGGLHVLQQATFIELEVSLIDYNPGGACYHEIDSFLRDLGFRLHYMNRGEVVEAYFKTPGIGQQDRIYVNEKSPMLFGENKLRGWQEGFRHCKGSNANSKPSRSRGSQRRHLSSVENPEASNVAEIEGSIAVDSAAEPRHLGLKAPLSRDAGYSGWTVACVAVGSAAMAVAVTLVVVRRSGHPALDSHSTI